MNSRTLEVLSQACSGKIYLGNPENNRVDELLYDSRKFVKGSNVLFVAIRSKRNDGHRYIETLVQSGVINFLVEYIPESVDHASCNFIVVPNTLLALQEIASQCRAEFKGEVLAITGSNGKTIVKEWLYTLCNADKRITRSPRSFNSQLGVALSLWNLDLKADLAIVEAGISEPGEMSRLEHMIAPDTVIFTNIGLAHAENFENQEQKITEKAVLVKQAKRIIYCADHQAINVALQKNFKEKCISWGMHPDAAIRINATAEKGRFVLKFEEKEIAIRMPFPDQASIENAFHCIAWMLVNGYSEAVINERLRLLHAPEMRLQRLQGIHHCVLLNDSWIADFDSLRMALQALKEHAGSLQRTLILSDLPDSGIAPNELYHRVEVLLHDFQITRLIGVGEQIHAYFENYSGQKHFFTSTAELIEALPALHLSKEAILLKGARVFAFEKVAAALQLKSHETVLQVNLNNLVSNFNYYRSLLPAQVKWMAMVKAFSYGAGTIEIAAALQTAGVDYLAVAFADEGIELRSGGIHLPIMVMNPEPDALIPIIEHQLEPEIYSTRVLKQFVEALNTRRGFDAERIRIHLKLDTGMHRLGFEEKDFEELISILKSYPEIEIASVFSHLAASAEPEHDAFTKAQINRFETWCEYLQNALNVKFHKHILNSGGIARHPEACFDMVRLGIGLYGIAEGSEQQHILPVGRMTTAVSQLRNVDANETVGYSRRGKLNRPSRIATLPVGYADGISRKLGNGAFYFTVNGFKVPTIGSICMDMCMVDVTDVPTVEEGDKVVIFSTAFDLHEMARNMETIPYEVLTHISQRVKRVYLQE